MVFNTDLLSDVKPALAEQSPHLGKSSRRSTILREQLWQTDSFDPKLVARRAKKTRCQLCQLVLQTGLLFHPFVNARQLELGNT